MRNISSIALFLVVVLLSAIATAQTPVPPPAQGRGAPLGEPGAEDLVAYYPADLAALIPK